MRVETEFWESLKTGRDVRVLVEASVGPRGFTPVRDHGVIISVEENRKLVLERIVIVDSETGEIE